MSRKRHFITTFKITTDSKEAEITHIANSYNIL